MTLRERMDLVEARFYELQDKNILTDAEYEEMMQLNAMLSEYNQY